MDNRSVISYEPIKNVIQDGGFGFFPNNGYIQGMIVDNPYKIKNSNEKMNNLSIYCSENLENKYSKEQLNSMVLVSNDDFAKETNWSIANKISNIKTTTTTKDNKYQSILPVIEKRYTFDYQNLKFEISFYVENKDYGKIEGLSSEEKKLLISLEGLKKNR